MNALETGMVLAGKYRIDEIIGTGGFGTTYLGYDLILQVKIVIKEYLRVLDNQKHLAEQEANLLSKTYSIQNIVRMMNFFYEDGCPYLIMEYVEGITLRDYLTQNRCIDARDAVIMLQPLIEALKQVHEVGMIHRDISPDNIMLSSDGTVTLIDFGSALEVTHVDSDLPVILKPGYAAPEQYQQNGNQGAWTDVYALCATVYRLIMGEKPPEAMALVTHSAQVMWNSDRLPESIARVLAAGMSIKQEARIQTMDELEKQLLQALYVKPIKQGKKSFYGVRVVIIITVLFAVLIGSFILRQGVEADSEEVTMNRTSQDNTESQVNKTPQDNTEPQMNKTPQDNTEPQVTVSMEYTPEDMFTTEDYGEVVAITGVDAELTEVNIPPTIGEKPVKLIAGMGANVVTVIIPEGVSSLGEYSFRNCRYLESIVIPSTVTEISMGAFQNCNSLQSVIIDDNNAHYYAVGNEIFDLTYGGKVE